MKGHWLSQDQKLEILIINAEGKEKGLPVTRTCEFWEINRCRVVRWRTKMKNGHGLHNRNPGPKAPVHKLLPEERQTVLNMAIKEEFADLSHRILAVTAWDLGIFFVSFSSVYRILVSANLMSMRGHHGQHNGRSIPPVRKELTGPNQRWCWDISYLLTHEKGLYLYLYLLLDEYSRKAIAWLISWHQTAKEAQYLLEQGLINENILDLPENQRPEIINDRGRQMKAKPIKRMFEDHHMPQLFARPRTPNDNPFIESMFSTVKGAPQYLGRFLDMEQALEYFNRYLPWYNSKHLHSGIDYVTPDQCHLGLREQIVARRKADLINQRRFRKEVNRQQQNILTEDLKPLILNFNQMTACSVINL
ncbi:MAG: DDE-type integrase/transposase/recombinase [Desulfobacterales bacterium]